MQKHLKILSCQSVSKSHQRPLKVWSLCLILLPSWRLLIREIRHGFQQHINSQYQQVTGMQLPCYILTFCICINLHLNGDANFFVFVFQIFEKKQYRTANLSRIGWKWKIQTKKLKCSNILFTAWSVRAKLCLFGKNYFQAFSSFLTFIIQEIFSNQQERIYKFFCINSNIFLLELDRILPQK